VFGSEFNLALDDRLLDAAKLLANTYFSGE
jgi:hypothetical protein